MIEQLLADLGEAKMKLFERLPDGNYKLKYDIAEAIRLTQEESEMSPKKAKQLITDFYRYCTGSFTKQDHFGFKINRRLGKWIASGKVLLDHNRNKDKYEDSNRSINCSNGMQLTPYSLANSVVGFVSEKYPQGRLVVPFKGLQKGNKLARQGENLSDILEHVVVKRYFFGSNDEPGNISVVDGDDRTRIIDFDLNNFIVIRDRVL